MTGTVTITSVTGPGIAVTAKVITNVATMLFDLKDGVLFITRNETPEGTLPQEEYSLTGVATVTATISGTVWTWSLS